jgi:hypothetical protein
MEKTWLRDALTTGMSVNAIKSGTVLTLGWFWARLHGCYVLYRRESVEEIDFGNIVGVCNLNAPEIRLTGLAHVMNTTYFYVLNSVNCCGHRESTFGAVTELEIDNRGDLLSGRPNSITEVRVLQVEGLKAVLEWYYCPLNQRAKAVRFKIYGDSGSGQVDYQNPLSIIEYNEQRFYRYPSDLPGLGRYLFVIRAADSNGVENKSSAHIRLDAAVTKPAPANIISTQTQ